MIKIPKDECPRTKHGIALPNFLVRVRERSCERKNILAIIRTNEPNTNFRHSLEQHGMFGTFSQFLDFLRTQHGMPIAALSGKSPLDPEIRRSYEQHEIASHIFFIVFSIVL